MWTRRDLIFRGGRAAAVAGAAGLASLGAAGGLLQAADSGREVRGRVKQLCGIAFERYASGKSNRRYLLIHGDESTARDVLAAHLREGRGQGIGYLVAQNASRYVDCRGGRLDPNRMFSNYGAEMNLARLNSQWNGAQLANAVIFLARKRHELINRLIPPPGGLVIAVHNNQRGYTMKAEEAISDRVAWNDPEHPEDFGLCVDPEDFDRLSKGKYNMVLQARPRGADDGSLSRLAVKLGFRYLNLEARLGNAVKQRQMLEWVEETLA